MRRFRLLALTLAFALGPSLTLAQTPPAPAPAQAPLSAQETAFVAIATADVQRLYPAIADAEKAGYRHYNNEDDSGAISYINIAYFDTPDPAHPSQLWYDVNGRLLGGDWTQTMASAPDGPTLFGLDRSRFHKIPLHVHYVLRKADGTLDYGLAVRASAFTAAGLDPLHPTAADLVTLGKVASAENVALVFALLANWDAQMWVIPNASGPFATYNPAVHPSPNQGKAPAERQM